MNEMYKKWAQEWGRMTLVAMMRAHRWADDDDDNWWLEQVKSHAVQAFHRARLARGEKKNDAERS